MSFPESLSLELGHLGAPSVISGAMGKVRMGGSGSPTAIVRNGAQEVEGISGFDYFTHDYFTH
jgi:hypothetical protein